MTAGEGIKQHYLLIGNIFAHQEEHIVTTVLGSCVSVCLWDSSLLIGGINHYMLPLWNGEGLPCPRYGNIAVVKLIEKMLNYGSQKKDLVAKIFGGGDLINSGSGLLNIGERNIILARDMLKAEKIPIFSYDVGGKKGRKIIFNTRTGTVLVKKLSNQIDDIKIMPQP